MANKIYVCVETTFPIASQIYSEVLKELERERQHKELRTSLNENWDQDILELELFFKNTKLPTVPFTLNEYCTITNASNFVNSHLVTLKANNGKEAFRSFLWRLQELKAIYENV